MQTNHENVSNKIESNIQNAPKYFWNFRKLAFSWFHTSIQHDQSINIHDVSLTCTYILSVGSWGEQKHIFLFLFSNIVILSFYKRNRFINIETSKSYRIEEKNINTVYINLDERITLWNWQEWRTWYHFRMYQRFIMLYRNNSPRKNVTGLKQYSENGVEYVKM